MLCSFDKDIFLFCVVFEYIVSAVSLCINYILDALFLIWQSSLCLFQQKSIHINHIQIKIFVICVTCSRSMVKFVEMCLCSSVMQLCGHWCAAFITVRTACRHWFSTREFLLLLPMCSKIQGWNYHGCSIQTIIQTIALQIATFILVGIMCLCTCQNHH